MLPLCHDDWRDVDEDEKLRLCDVLCLYVMDDKLQVYALATAAKKWRDFKSDLKRTKFDETKTDEELLAACDSRVHKKEWAWLIKYWRSPEGQARSERGKTNRAKLKTPHTAGSKSFARVGHQWSEQHGRKPRRHELFVITHTPKDGAASTQAEPQIKALELAALKYPELQEKSINEGDLYSHIFGREPRGHVRSVGLGPTPSSLRIPGHRKYTPTRVQVALAGRRRAEREVALLREELKKKALISEGSTEAKPDVDNPLEQGSNPTPNMKIGDDAADDDYDLDEESCQEEINLPEHHEILRRRVAAPSTSRSEGGGKEVFLLSLFGPYNAPVAKATIQSTNPKEKVGGTELGNECYEVVVDSVMKKDALLLRPYGNIKTMGDVFGKSIAWPRQKMMNNVKAARPYTNIQLSGGR